jgi:acid phosphatase
MNVFMKLAGATALATLVSFAAQAQDAKPNDGLNAALWYQTSVEYKATAKSVYAGAQRLLGAAIGDHSWTATLAQGDNYMSKSPAIILDVDETVLDNSAYQSWVVTADSSYSSKTWAEFVNTEMSTPTPGALELTKAAADKGVAVYYVTNRKAGEEAATINNLKKYGFPDADADHVMVRGEKPEWGSDKGTRWEAVAADHRIIMMFGDNFGDFVDDMGGDIKGRIAKMDEYADYWGERWFMLPNPTYGSWESAAFGDNWKLSPEERRQMKTDALNDWEGPK